MKAEKLLELLNELDDELLAEALAANNGKKLRALALSERKLRLQPVLLKIAVLFLCVAIILASAILGKLDKNQISNFTGNNSLPSQNSGLNEQSSENESYSSDKDTDSQGNESLGNPHTFSESVNSDSLTDYHESSDISHNVEDEPTSKQPEKEYYIECIDEFNFYTVKTAIENNGVLPIANSASKGLSATAIKGTARYEFNRETPFSITRGTYFKITLYNEQGFLAKKLGGLGMVEVVVLENSISDMITFKRGDNFYSCILDKKYSTPLGSYTESRLVFNTNKYIEGFKIIENTDAVAFQYTAHYRRYNTNREAAYKYSELCDFVAKHTSSDSTTETDYIIFNKNSAKIVNINKEVTIKQLDEYFKNLNK